MPALQKPPSRTEAGANPTRVAASGTRIAADDAGLSARFLELPGPVVLVTLWLAGAALIGSCAAALYYLFWLLMAALAGL
jgi:hypothetical protein